VLPFSEDFWKFLKLNEDFRGRFRDLSTSNHIFKTFKYYKLVSKLDAIINYFINYCSGNRKCLEILLSRVLVRVILI